MQPTAKTASFLSRRQWLARSGACLAATPSLLSLVACGGGGGADTTVPPVTTTAGSVAMGAITGFGSIIVNGVRYDDSAADLRDDDGTRLSAAALQLGVVVTVEGGKVDDGGRASAQRIRCDDGLLGPLEAVDTSTGQVTVLGQTVVVTADTLLDSTLSTDLSTWTLGAVLHVHGWLDSGTGLITATRVEQSSGATQYRLRGTVSALDTTAKTFAIGGALISYASANPVKTDLADGDVVRVRMQTTAVEGRWVASRVVGGRRSLSDASEAHVHGTITAWTSATAFEVDGVVVNASAASFPDGQTGVVLGARVEVEGTLSSGVLVAVKVELDDSSSTGSAGGDDSGSDDSGSDDDHGGGEDHGGGRKRREFELHGTLSALDTSAQTFVLRGMTVSYASTALVWKDGLSADSLAALQASGQALEVKGVVAADRSVLTASRISLED
ncbi:DUF5666 domain-containing protein [Ideonella livida]|uniref:DUF5666 domain-containing protein n=1 Tax=Ideonella livida TaxID=2707176 RepID=A0A7C9TIT2_9BURK|nr:DUF5666 domain-containing protein [Ideonella livida]NDY91559.1 hypothetical protein [Ideonella livida]